MHAEVAAVKVGRDVEQGYLEDGAGHPVDARAYAAVGDAGVGAIGLWREPVQEVGLATAAKMLADSGLRFSSHCRGGFFTVAALRLVRPVPPTA